MNGAAGEVFFQNFCVDLSDSVVCIVADSDFLFFFRFCLTFRALAVGKDEIGEDTEDQCASHRGDGDFSESQDQTADARNQDGRYDEQVAVFTKVNRLDHLQAGDCDEAVERDAHTAHDATRNGGEEGDERCEEGSCDCKESSCGDGDYGSVSADCDASD